MDHPQAFLLKKIVGWKENGLESLGHLDAKHVKDLSEVLRLYAEEAMTELIERLNKGETVYINETTGITLKRQSKRKKLTHG